MKSAKPGTRTVDRRRSPRAHCRLQGRVRLGRERLRVRIIDVSEGGLCLLSPVWLDPKKPVQIEIDVPGRGVSLARIEIWHIRREKSRVSTNKVWVAGAILVDADGVWSELLAATGLTSASPGRRSTPAGDAPGAGPIETQSSPLPPPAPPQRPTRVAPEPAVEAALEAANPRVFRLRCRARGSPRTRMLSIAAESESHALDLARQSLGAEWNVLEALET